MSFLLRRVLSSSLHSYFGSVRVATGAAVSSRKAIQTSLGGSATFSDCTITITCAHRPWGYGGGGGGNSGGGGGGGDAHVEEKEEEEEEEEEEVDMGGGMDTFGGDEGGGDDY